MAQPIGELVIGLSMDGSQFSNTIKGINKQVKSAESAMKANLAVISNAGDEYDTLKARISGLTNVMNVNQKKIELLREKYKQTAKTFGESSEQASSLARQINNAIQRQSGWEKQLKTSNKQLQLYDKKLGVVSRHIKELGEQASEAGQKISHNLTPILSTLAGMSLIGDSSEASDGFAKIENATNLTGKALERAKQTAQDLWSEGFGSDLNDATNAVIQVRNNMKGLSEKDIKSATRNAMNLANIFDSDVNEVTRAGNSLMQNYGLSSKQAFDMMAKGAKNGMNFSNEMFDNMSEYSINFKEAGFSADEMFKILSNGAKKGYNLDRLNDTMLEFKLQSEDSSKSYLGAMAQMSTKTQGVFEDYQNGKASVGDLYKVLIPDLKKMKKEMPDKEFNVVGKALFGTKWEDQGAEVVLSMDTTNKAMNKTKGTMKEMNKVTEESFGQKLRSTLRSLKKAFLPIGDAILNVVTVAIPPLTKALDYLTDKMNGMSDHTKKIIGVISIIGLAIAPVILVVGHLATAFMGFYPVISKVISVISKLNTPFRVLSSIIGVLSNPITIAIAVIAGLGVAFYTLYKKSEPFRKLIKELGTIIGTQFKSIIAGFSTFFGSQMKKIKGFWDKDGKSIMTGINKAIKFLSPVIKGGLKLAFAVVKSILNNIKGVISGALDFILGTVDFFIGLFTGNWKKMWNGLKTMFKGAFRFLWNLIQLSFYGKILKGFSVFGKGILKAGKGLLNKVKSGLGSLKDLTVSSLGKLKDKALSIFDKVVKTVKEMPRKMGDALKNGAGAVKNGAITIGKRMIEGVAKGVNGVGTGINWILDKVHAPDKWRIPKWSIPKYKRGTDYHEGGTAIVGDGNKKELIQLPNGQTMLSPNRSTMVNLPKGTSVLNGNDTESLLKNIPFYKNGTSKIAEVFKAGKNKIKDIFDYMENPSKLLNIVLGKYTKINGLGQLGSSLASGMKNTFAKASLGFITKAFNFGGGDAPAGEGVKRWTSQLKRALKMNGLPASGAYVNAWLRQIATESGGNEKAVQHGYTDINTLTGNLATGLLQTIRPTFDAYKFKGHGNILNGFDNMLSAIAYAKSRYGAKDMLKVIGHGHGYANGGLVTSHQLAEIGEGNKPEMVIPLSSAKRGRALQLLARTQQILGVNSPTVASSGGSNSAMIERQDAQIALMQQQLNILTAILAKDNGVYLDGKEIYNSNTKYLAKANKITNIARGI